MPSGRDSIRMYSKLCVFSPTSVWLVPTISPPRSGIHCSRKSRMLTAPCQQPASQASDASDGDAGVAGALAVGAAGAGTCACACAAAMAIPPQRPAARMRSANRGLREVVIALVTVAG